MTHPIWPFYDLCVRTPQIELRYVDDELATDLAALAAKGIHEPGVMPFISPWTEVPSPQIERNTVQSFWRRRAELSAAAWTLSLAVIVGGSVAGLTAVEASDFPTLRQFRTGSWLGRDFQGQGIGKEMRLASLHLGFLGFAAEIATTAAFDDNGPSLGVTRSLGYHGNGQSLIARGGRPATSLNFQMTRADFLARLQRDDITLHGVEACVPLLGLAEDPLSPDR